MQACVINGLRIGEGSPVRLMGVINCSPESFYRGSYVRPEETRMKALAMVEDGADLVDVGARATGPGSRPLPAGIEQERMVSALSALEGSGVTISVDTTQPEVLAACLRYDIHAVNDIGGLSNPRFAGILRDSGLPAILMASRAVPGDAVGFPATLETLRLVVERCGEFGIREVILDPGIGRWIPGRTGRDDWDLVRNFGKFRACGRPLLAAVSRKTFIGELLGRGPEERLPGSLAVTILLAMEGASVVRTHDARETKDVLSVLAEVKGGVNAGFSVIGVRTPLIRAGDDLPSVILDAARESPAGGIRDGDILVIAESPVATAEGRAVVLERVTPSSRAVRLGERFGMDPRFVEVVLGESDRVVGGVRGFLLTMKQGTLLPNAGVDLSNTPPGTALPLPKDPDGSAVRIRKAVQERTGRRVAVIIADSRTHAMRLGCSSVAIGCAGIRAVIDERGRTDLYGHVLEVTQRAVADNIASAAVLVMGEADESVPCAIIRGLGLPMVEEVGVPAIAAEECLFMGVALHADPSALGGKGKT